jgi:uncharacterized protein
MHKHYSFLYFSCLLGLAACVHPRSIVLSPSAPEGVRVYGVGEAAGTPDVARTQLGVETRSATAEQAVADASQRMAAVVAALKGLGIEDKDLRTSQYSLSFEPERPQPPAAAAPAAGAKAQPTAAEAKAEPRGRYRAVNSLTVTIRDLKKVGQVLQVAADADANSAYGINFDLEDDAALIAEARKLALADAQNSAQELAKLTGVELGEVVSITEEEPEDNQPNTYALQNAPANVPVEEGEVTVRYSVQLVYATKRK